MSLTTDLDRVITSEPNDKTAALVTGTGIHWEPERPQNWPANSYDAPPPTFRLRDKNFCDHTGKSYHRVRVIGCIRMARSGPLWLVRCQCGAWEDRSQRAVENQAGGRCWRCDKLWRLQRGLDDQSRTMQRVAKAATAHKPANVTETVLASKAVRRAKLEPTTAMAAALARALQKRIG
jgi:hypothetical protein